MSATKVLHLRSGTHLFGPERVILALARCTSPAFLPIIGGIQRNAESLLLQEAARQGFEICSFASRSRLDFALIRRLAEFVRQNDIGVLHAHDFRANFYALAAARALPVRTVTTLHLWNRNSLLTAAYEAFDALQVRRFDAIIAVSPEIAAEARRWRIPKQKLRVILNGVDLSRFEKVPPLFSGPRLVIGSVGRLVPQKGYHIFLGAAAKVSQALPEARFLLVGDGPLRQELQQEARRLGLQDRFAFAGQKDPIEAAYGEIDIFVSSSLSEGLPIALLEAMAARRPVVATTVGAVPQVIEGGRSGLLVKPNDVEALAVAILRLAKDKELAMSLAAVGYAQIARNFSAENMTRKTEAVYLELLHGKT